MGKHTNPYTKDFLAKRRIVDGKVERILEGRDHPNLRPCPFCGSDSVIMEHTWTPSYWVECEDCGARVSDNRSRTWDNPDLISLAFHKRSMRYAAEAWNSRVPHAD